MRGVRSTSFQRAPQDEPEKAADRDEKQSANYGEVKHRAALVKRQLAANARVNEGPQQGSSPLLVLHAWNWRRTRSAWRQATSTPPEGYLSQELGTLGHGRQSVSGVS